MSGHRCNICDRGVALAIIHCHRCRDYTCDGDVCEDIQDKVCEGKHVHEGDTCHLCGPIDYGSDCEPDFQVTPRTVVPA